MIPIVGRRVTAADIVSALGSRLLPMPIATGVGRACTFAWVDGAVIAAYRC